MPGGSKGDLGRLNVRWTDAALHEIAPVTFRGGRDLFRRVIVSASEVLDPRGAVHLQGQEDDYPCAAHYPVLTSAITDYFEGGATVEDLYQDSIRLILAGPADGK